MFFKWKWKKNFQHTPTGDDITTNDVWVLRTQHNAENGGKRLRADEWAFCNCAGSSAHQASPPWSLALHQMLANEWLRRQATHNAPAHLLCCPTEPGLPVWGPLI